MDVSTIVGNNRDSLAFLRTSRCNHDRHPAHTSRIGRVDKRTPVCRVLNGGKNSYAGMIVRPGDLVHTADARILYVPLMPRRLAVAPTAQQ